MGRGADPGLDARIDMPEIGVTLQMAVI